MRRLKSTDLFTAMRFVKAAGLREYVAEIALKAKKKGIKQEELGADMIIGIFEASAEKNAEEKLYEFISGPLEISVEELKEMELLELFDTLKNFLSIEDKEGWQSFFQSLASLMK